MRMFLSMIEKTTPWSHHVICVEEN